MNKKLWFKSNQFLVDIADFYAFTVIKRPKCIFWFWKKEYKLLGWRVAKEGYYEYPHSRVGWNEPVTKSQLLGVYNTEDEASIALDNILEIKEAQ